MAKPKAIGWQWKKMPTPYHGKAYRVWSDVEGKRKQYWFATEKEAKEDCADRNREREAYGTKVNLDSEARLEAFRAAELLQPYGKTIMDAVHHYLEHLNQISVSVPFSRLAVKIREEFSRRIAANEVSARHAESMDETLRKMELRFGKELVSEIRPEDVRSWLTGLPLATKTRNKHRGYASQIFNLAVDYGYTPVNPVTKIKKFNERVTEENGEISILSAAQTETLFRAAQREHPEVITFLTLSFFCGIRRATLERLDWSNVRFEEKRVIVPAYKGKNQERYQVYLSDNAVEWLRPYVRPNGSLLVSATAINRYSKAKGKPSQVATRDRILKAAKTADVTLPDNVGRHTFISMHVAHFESMDKTALEANTSVEKIKSNYLDLITKADAKRYWGIRPAQQPVNVVPMTTAAA
jgi:integrase